MNKFKKMAIVAAGAALAIQGAFAANNNNLILSVNNNNGGGSTEFTVNLGLISSFTPIPNYDLSSFLSTFNSQYASAGASGLNVGVAGGQSNGGLSGVGNDVFTTSLRVGNTGQYTVAGTEGAPGVNPSKANIGSAGAVVSGTITFGSNVATSDGNSFTSAIAKDSTTAGTNPNNFTGNLGIAADPLQHMTGSTITLDLWKDTVVTSTTLSGWVYQGSFTFDLSGANPSLIFDAATPVPEPSTYGLLGGAGLLALSLRNQFRRKNA